MSESESILAPKLEREFEKVGPTLRHQYPQTGLPVEREGVKISSLQDIAAMKLNAITNRGAKKDFYDLYFLLRQFSLPQLLDWYERKYRNHDLFFVVRSLTWFDDAENEPAPQLREYVSWSTVKNSIKSAVKDLAGKDSSNSDL